MKGPKTRESKQLTIVIKLGEIQDCWGPSEGTCLTALGTSSIVDEITHQPILSSLSMIVETAVKLLKDGHRVIIVSSGAIGVGLRRMDMEKKPTHLPQIQVCDPDRCMLGEIECGCSLNLTSMTIGTCGSRTIPLNVPVGLSIQPHAAACRSDPPDSE